MRQHAARTALPNLVEDEPALPVDKDAAPVGIHPGVLCDATLNPITGYKYTKIGSRPSYDLCQAAYDELEAAEASQFERSPPPITPRRTLAAMAALALGIALSRASPEAPAAPKQRDPRLFYEDFVEIPPLSPAEQLVAFFFRPQAMATQREAAPTAKRRAARASSPQMSVAATSLACADEPPPLRTPSIPPPSFLPAPLRRQWRASLGCEFCADSKRAPCPNCDAEGGYLAMGGTPVVCKACRGTGRVVCRECFTGDGFDIESIRRQMGYPD
jgi:hypothetical protein